MKERRRKRKNINFLFFETKKRSCLLRTSFVLEPKFFILFHNLKRKEERKEGRKEVEEKAIKVLMKELSLFLSTDWIFWLKSIFFFFSRSLFYSLFLYFNLPLCSIFLNQKMEEKEEEKKRREPKESNKKSNFSNSESVSFPIHSLLFLIHFFHSFRFLIFYN